MIRHELLQLVGIPLTGHDSVRAIAIGWCSAKRSLTGHDLAQSTAIGWHSAKRSLTDLASVGSAAAASTTDEVVPDTVCVVEELSLSRFSLTSIWSKVGVLFRQSTRFESASNVFLETAE